MKTRALRLPDRSWLWFVCGAALLPVSGIVPNVALAAWVAPVFLLRFARTRSVRAGIPLLALAHAVALGLNVLVGTWPVAVYAVGGVSMGLLTTLAYLADRLLAPRLAGLARTLVFPLALTTIDWLGSSLAGLVRGLPLPSLLGGGGVLDSPGYSQADLLPLVQIVAVTGMWGLTFLIAWFASTVTAVWEQRGTWRAVPTPLLAWGATLVAVVAFGVVRLASPVPAGAEVHVAGIAPRSELYAAITDVDPERLTPGTPEQRATAHRRLAPIVDDLVARTEQAARAGARIISWAEIAATVLEEDEPALVARAAALAQREGIYLQIGVMVLRNTEHFPTVENRALLLDPSGAVVWDYHKAAPAPLENRNLLAGPPRVPTVDTPYGRLATVICYDADFPQLVRQAGQAGVHLLMVPSSDWESFRVQNARMATFRAIENGVWLLRPVQDGISAVVDPNGRAIVQVDSFGGGEPTATAVIAAGRTPTLYARFDDWFAYLSVAGLLSLVVLARLRPRVSPAPRTVDAPVQA